jgi:hypothetical protein
MIKSHHTPGNFYEFPDNFKEFSGILGIMRNFQEFWDIFGLS